MFETKILSTEFKEVLDCLENTNDSYFITGKAGTGKSTLLRLFVKTTRKKVVVLAPTGIAALNIGGQTIHSFFSFPPRIITSQEVKRKRYDTMYKKIDTIIIDEISMVRADVMDGIDYFLRINRGKPKEKFGGVQMVFFGDVFQLPPVSGKGSEKQLMDIMYASPYFFNASVFGTNFYFTGLELGEVYRQESKFFKNLLDKIRLQSFEDTDLEILNERIIEESFDEDQYITLSPRNFKVQAINNKRLQELETPIKNYFSKIDGDFQVKNYPTQAVLSLKVGAQVMFIKNDPSKKFVNGTIGTIVELKEDQVLVRVKEFGQERIVETGFMEWENVKYKPAVNSFVKNPFEVVVTGTFNQIPLRLAWAITIHKSQGKTFEKVIIDLAGGAFEHGQSYVALSRCKTLEGIIMKQKIQSKDIIIHQEVIDFYNQYIV